MRNAQESLFFFDLMQCRCFANREGDSRPEMWTMLSFVLPARSKLSFRDPVALLEFN